jgi:hypothetical protein
VKKGRSYRLNKATLAILVRNGEKAAVTIPLGGTVTVSEDTLKGERLIEVIWNGKIAMLFSQDLRARGELVDSADA